MVRQAGDRQDAGHIAAGESEIDVLKREAEEELGIKGDLKYELVGRTVFNRHVLGRQENHLFVLFKILFNAEPILNHESVSYKYFTEQGIARRIEKSPGKVRRRLPFRSKDVFAHLQ